jgi:ABC-type xylose transport system permease subunit
MSIAERFKAPTPKFWKKIQKIGLTLGAIGGILVAAPITLPAAIVTAAGYMVVAGGVTATLSQLTVIDNETNN